MTNARRIRVPLAAGVLRVPVVVGVLGTLAFASVGYAATGDGRGAARDAPASAAAARLQALAARSSAPFPGFVLDRGRYVTVDVPGARTPRPARSTTAGTSSGSAATSSPTPAATTPDPGPTCRTADAPVWTPRRCSA